MTLFDYSKCESCKKNKNDIKTELSKVLPVNVCNLVGDCDIKCFKCRSLYLKEIDFMKDKEIPDEELRKAELQLDLFRKMFMFRDPMKYPEIFQNYPKKINNMFDKESVKERFNGRKMYYQALKSFCKKNPLQLKDS